MPKMNLKSICILFVLILVVAPLLVACGGDAATATRPANTTVAATTALATTAPATTVAATTAPATTVAATTTAPTSKPSVTTAASTIGKAPATATTSASASAATNTVTGLGITMRFPATWSTNVQDKDDEGLLSGTNPDGSYITIYRFTKGDAVQGDLMTRANNLVSNLKTTYPDLVVLDKATQIKSDIIRLVIQFTSKDTGKVNQEVVMVIDDASLKATYLVEAGAEKAKFDTKTQDTLSAILDSISVNPVAATSLPTAAPTAPETVVKGLGINITFPADWRTQVNEKAGEGSILSISPQGSYVNIYRFTTGTLVQGALTDRATAVINYLKELYPDLTVIEKPNLVSGDTARFSSQYTDPDKKNVNVEVVVVIDDANLNATYVVEAGADKARFAGQKDILSSIVNTLKTN